MDLYNSTLDFWTVYGDVYIDFHLGSHVYERFTNYASATTRLDGCMVNASAVMSTLMVK